jgi:hypothetical protein
MACDKQSDDTDICPRGHLEHREAIMDSNTCAERYLGNNAVKERYGGISDMTVDRWVAAGILPPPDYFGRLRMWALSKLEANERSPDRKRRPPQTAPKERKQRASKESLLATNTA